MICENCGEAEAIKQLGSGKWECGPCIRSEYEYAVRHVIDEGCEHASETMCFDCWIQGK